MSHSKHHLIYCSDNQPVASQISKELGSFGYSTELHNISDGGASGKLKDLAIDTSDGKVLLLVTDNFLKTAAGMESALPVVSQWANAGVLYPVVADGTAQGDDGKLMAVPTSFERVSNIIQYMNFWQDRYLEYRKLKRTEGDSPELNQKIEVTKAISADIGELLRYLRGIPYFSLEEFQANGYADFRIANGEEVKVSGEAEFGELQEQSEGDSSLVQMIEGSSAELIAENTELDQPYEGIENEVSEMVDEATPTSEAQKETEAEEPPISEEFIAEIPGMSLLDETETDPADDPTLDPEAEALIDELMAFEEPDEEPDADSPQAEEEVPSGISTADKMPDQKSDSDELNSVIDEVLEEEGFGDSDEDDSEYKFLGEDPENPSDFDLDSIFEDDENIKHQNGESQTEELEADENEVILDLLDDEDEEVVAVSEGKKVSPEEVLEYALDLFSENRQEEGLSHLKNTVENNPENTTLRYYYAYSLARYGKDIEGAKQHLETLLNQDSRHPEAWHLFGELAESQEDYEGARKCFEKAININPNYPDIHYRLGLLTVRHFPGEEKKAATWFRKAIKEDAQNADAEYALANVLNQRLGEPEIATKHFKRTLKIKPDHPYANYDLALIHYKWGNREEAAKFYQAAIAVNPALKTAQNDAAFHFEPTPVEQAVAETTTKGKLEAVESTVETAVAEDFFLEDTPIAVAKTKESELESTSKTVEEPIVTTAETDEPESKKSNDGPVVLITGGTAGIGRATANIFAKNGYRVIITGRREERLEEIKNEFAEAYQNDIQTLAFDVRDPAAMKAALENLPQEWKEVDILVNNAGLSQGLAPIHEGELKDWDTMIDTNVKGLLYMTRAIVPQMVARRSGLIINLASGAAKEVYPGGNVYCATKSAVEALTKGMRLDLLPHNVRVGQVSPGHVEETEFARVRFDWDVERAAKTYENFQPLRSSDVAEAIYFMATRPPHVNIHDIFLNGTQQASSNFIERSGRED